MLDEVAFRARSCRSLGRVARSHLWPLRAEAHPPRAARAGPWHYQDSRRRAGGLPEERHGGDGAEGGSAAPAHEVEAPKGLTDRFAGGVPHVVGALRQMLVDLRDGGRIPMPHEQRAGERIDSRFQGTVQPRMTKVVETEVLADRTLQTAEAAVYGE